MSSSCIVNERSRNTCKCATNLEIYFTYSVHLNPIYPIFKNCQMMNYWVALITIIHYQNWLNYLPNEQQTRTTDFYSTSETTSVEPRSPIVVWRFLSVPRRYYSVTWTLDPTWRPLDTQRPCVKVWVYVWRPAPVYCPVHLRVMEGRDSWLYFRGPYHYPPPL